MDQLEPTAEEGIMGIIMINCPATGRDVSTGIETTDIEGLPAVTAKMVCPACGHVHDWNKADAWLAHSGEQYGLRALTR
jgi:glycine cleavage system H lipoate-binding protein